MDLILISVDMIELDLYNATGLKEKLEEFDLPKCDIIIDIHKVGRMDSSALGAIIHIYSSLKKLNLELVVCGATYYIRKLFHICKFDRFLPLFETVDEAMDYFQGKLVHSEELKVENISIKNGVVYLRKK
ncbi:MAG: STAS domain-containing protein [bacterium]|nr:STAS domain-containing protein [bacterium]